MDTASYYLYNDSVLVLHGLHRIGGTMKIQVHQSTIIVDTLGFGLFLGKQNGFVIHYSSGFYFEIYNFGKATK